ARRRRNTCDISSLSNTARRRWIAGRSDLFLFGRALTVALVFTGSVGCQRVDGAPSPPPRTPTAHPSATQHTPKPSATSQPSSKPSTSKRLSAIPKPKVRPYDDTYTGDSSLSGARRARHALAAKGTIVRALFTAAGVPFPPRQLLFRVYKREMHLEVWAQGRANAPFSRVATYAICATSGDSGPKRREGDGQVPEGFYSIDLYNPHSSYYLAMRVSYPNKRDRRLHHTGSAIMIHGNCVSIGCLAMTDARIEELWTMADAVRRKRRVHVHIYPQRDLAAAISKAKDPKLAAFWKNIRVGKDLFDARHTIPRIAVDRHGRYTFR
ncbi:MAG: L,D-transpeptidase family protein, partial [Deltaproteobacteria bacterium]|nr:L,D-transpeptidase family protein [Deltaproteobacteria bacterium]